MLAQRKEMNGVKSALGFCLPPGKVRRETRSENYQKTTSPGRWSSPSASGGSRSRIARLSTEASNSISTLRMPKTCSFNATIYHGRNRITASTDLQSLTGAPPQTRSAHTMSRNIAIDRPRSLSEVITERLRDAITSGEFAPGEAMSEDALAAELGTSRTPVREALSTLQYQGLVTIVPQKGTFVFAPTADDVHALCDFRATLEVKAARLAIGNRQADTLAALKSAFAEMKRAQKKGDHRAYARADNQFHVAFLDHCANPYLQSAYLLASGRVGALRAHLSSQIAGEPERSYDEHQEIIELWSKGDMAAIEVILVQHIMRTEQSYLRAFENGLIPVGEKNAAGSPEKKKRRAKLATS
jgi:DNA-binding GntR family transcriptional regulator